LIVYADSSFLASLFSRDANTPAALDVVRAGLSGFLFTPFHRVELTHAFMARVFRRDWPAEHAHALLNDLDGALYSPLLRAWDPDWSLVFSGAERLASEWAPATGVRTLDTLHVACARQAGATRFVSFDRRQNQLAGLAGLKLWP
jgi:predicted nucleic acid-binding protein